MTDKEALIGAGVMGGAIALGLRCLIRTEQKLTLWPAGAQPRLKARLQGATDADYVILPASIPRRLSGRRSSEHTGLQKSARNTDY